MQLRSDWPSTYRVLKHRVTSHMKPNPYELSKPRSHLVLELFLNIFEVVRNTPMTEALKT